MVRFLVLAAVAAILVLKLYLLLFVMDFTVGLYNFLTTFILFSILIRAWMAYKDPYLKAKDIDLLNVKLPLVSIVVPAKNEEDNIRNCVLSCINQSYKNKEVIIIDDCSTDNTPKILDKIQKEAGPDKLTVIYLSKSVGKKQAIEVASQIAKGEIYAFMDSDCNMDSDAVEKAAKIFLSDRLVGAVTAQGTVRGAHTGNILLKMQHVYIDGACRVIKGSEAHLIHLPAASGSLSFYKREAIQDFIHDWAHDRFLGVDFKFWTDRRMTAHVLGTKAILYNNILNNKQDCRYKTIPILRAGKDDDIDTMKSSSDPNIDDDKVTAPRPYWKVLYSLSIRVTIGVPDNLPALLKQQIRWRKTFTGVLFQQEKYFRDVHFMELCCIT